MLNVYTNREEKAFVENIINSIRLLGYNIIRARINRVKTEKYCQVIIERADKTKIVLSDCVRVNSIVVKSLRNFDKKNIHHNRVEVSSPGINRPLTRLRDFVSSLGKEVKVLTGYKVNGRRTFVGKLLKVTSNKLEIETMKSMQAISLEFHLVLEVYLKLNLNNK